MVILMSYIVTPVHLPVLHHTNTILEIVQTIREQTRMMAMHFYFPLQLPLGGSGNLQGNINDTMQSIIQEL